MINDELAAHHSAFCLLPSAFLPGFRLLILALILPLLLPAPILITPEPPQTVHTSHPIVGVHTRLTDEVEEWKIQRTLQMVREMGAPWVVEFFPWAYYHAADGGIAWEHPDLVINHAHAQGLQVIARIGLTPDWARPKDTPLTYLDATAYNDFADFAAAFAERYRGKVQAIIIGNEPNLNYEWGYRITTYQDYVDLLKVVYTAVKAANPDITVLAGALAPTLEPKGSPWGLNDLDYLAGMYQAGAADYFDGLAVHAYGLTFPPETEPSPDLLNFRRVELVRQVMVEHGDAAKSIYITETGWNDHPRWTMAVRPGQRIQYTLDALRYAETNWPYVKMVAIWAFRFPAPTKSYMDYYTLVTPEFVKKPIYDEIQRYTGN
ncbi:MAG: cellulase family glycosylhydrolase [Ardenticatenaceae bacterium]|nr:cellulase family glycosylhydrolase [Ardenticatenaceae bacterium]MCB9442999.1 cellulase family glycosylhydrolase [Ardenticatenaceae bacterium]